MDFLFTVPYSMQCSPNILVEDGRLVLISLSHFNNVLNSQQAPDPPQPSDYYLMHFRLGFSVEDLGAWGFHNIS